MLQTLFLFLHLTVLPTGYDCSSPPDVAPQFNYCEVPTDLRNIRLHITNYQPYDLSFDANGMPIYSFHTETNYQCYSPCNQTANGTVIVDPLTQNIAACPIEWVNNRVKVVLNGVIWHCEDTFGLVSRQNGLVWHDELGEWFLYLDLLTHNPTYYQTNDYQLVVNGQLIKQVK